MCWLIACNTEGTFALRRNSNFLSRNKEIRNISFVLDLMKNINPKRRLEFLQGV